MVADAPLATRRSRAGFALLRIALACGLFILVTFVGFGRPLPGAPGWLLELGNRMFEAGMVLGLVAPLLAIVGAILSFRARRRLSALDWVSFGFGMMCLLLPLMFILAYSNCPNGIC